MRARASHLPCSFILLMTRRQRTYSTAAAALHLILFASLFTTGIPAQTVSGVQGEEVTIKAKEQEKKKNIFTLRGDVEITYKDYTLRADEVTYDTDSGQITATGNLSADGGAHDEHIEASHGEYNLKTERGRFFDVVGSTGVRFKGRNVTLTNDYPFVFTGKEVEKDGDKYIVHHGSVTSCELPNPKWTFNAERVEFTPNGTARIYHSNFRVEKVPIFYFPFVAHPVNKAGRESGFLIPNFGASSRKGTIIGDSFFWAINRSMDATIGAEYYSSRGWAQHGQFRARPTERTTVNASYFGVLDRGFGPNKIDQGGQDINLDAETILPFDIRAVANVNYLSSFVFRLAFTEQFSQAVNSEVKSLVFFSKDYQNYFFNAYAARYQNFQSATRGDLITILHVPSFEALSTDHPVWRTPFYWSYDVAVEGVSRREPTFKTNDLLGRFDLEPRLSLPLQWRGWSFRSELALRNTFYTQSKLEFSPVSPIVDNLLNRRAFDLYGELRAPSMSRVFDRPVFGRKVKHSFEPFAAYRVVNGVSVFPKVVRFDDRDILSDTDELQYGLVQRLYLKRLNGCGALEGCPGQEFITWSVENRYYFDPNFGSSVINGKRNVLASTVDLTGIGFLTEPRRFSPVISKLRVRTSEDSDVQWQLDYDPKKGRINSSAVFATWRINQFFVGGSHSFFHVPGEIFVTNPLPAPDKFDQYRILAGFGNPSRRGLNAAATFGFDQTKKFLQYGSFQTSYNWDCCGLSMEYRRFALGTVRNENQFRFAFSLANVGTFGNLRRQASLF
jgi:LPS-assembly protein